MATFVNVYIHSFINLPTPGKIIQQVYLLLPEEQLELFRELETSLLQRGILQPWALFRVSFRAWPQISSWVRSCMLVWFKIWPFWGSFFILLGICDKLAWSNIYKIFLLSLVLLCSYLLTLIKFYKCKHSILNRNSNVWLWNRCCGGLYCQPF